MEASRSLELTTSCRRNESAFITDEAIGRRQRETSEPSKEVTQNPEEGRGDPTLTMMWSPEKICGSKRTLAERSETDDESEDIAEEDGERYEAEDEATDDEAAEDVAAEEAVGEEHLMGTTAMALDVTEEEQTPDGSLRAESDLTKNHHHEELMATVQGVTESGALESTPLHLGGLESNLHSHATGTQQGNKTCILETKVMAGSRRQLMPKRQGRLAEKAQLNEGEEARGREETGPEAANGHSGATSPSPAEADSTLAEPVRGQHEVWPDGQRTANERASKNPLVSDNMGKNDLGKTVMESRERKAGMPPTAQFSQKPQLPK